MCGIIGYLGQKEVVPILIDGLRRLEYRGYDSAGVAVVRNGQIERRRSAGKLVNLEQAIDIQPLEGIYGVGHTRWATHGRPTEENAHPHQDCTGKIVVVHNGIIENYLDLKHELQKLGHKFVTETDTEIIAHLIEQEMGSDHKLEEAARRALLHMRGLFAFVAISTEDPEKIIAVRNGPPIVVGIGENEFFVASDTPAILSHTRDVVFLGDEEMAVITRRGVEFSDFAGTPVSKATQRVLWDPIMAEKAGYRHFMLKEIFEQPRAAEETLLGRLSIDTGRVFLEEIGITDADLRGINKVALIACGTSWHAALVGKFLIERFAGLPVEVDYGSEYRYRDFIVDREYARRHHHAVRRNRRHAGRTSRGAQEGRAQPGHLQRRRQHGDERIRGHHLHARRAGNRRGVDEGLHVAARRAERARAVPRPDERHAGRIGTPGAISTRSCSFRIRWSRP